jgi:alkanesulfonate monooxygenase SsuD/methylene tetrahydromethanopterin reductase-like flavin-dependent oxidoreductase (luciferase family)
MMILSTSKLSFGINLSLSLSSPFRSHLITEARQAEALGFDLVTVHPDHPGATAQFGPDACLETWTALSWIAAQTTTVQVAPCILALPYRHPAMIAKMAETFDRLSGGRLILALGAGGVDQGAQAFGLTRRSAAEKVEALEEAIDIIRGLWSQSRFSYLGKHFTVHEATLEPKPARRIPIWLGGHGKSMLDLVGRKADGWLPTLHFLVHVLGREPEHLYEMQQQVRQAAAAAGRDPDTITHACNVAVLVSERAGKLRGQIVGGPEEIIEQLLVFLHRGFTFLNFWTSGDERWQREQLAQEIIPALHSYRKGER